MIYPVVGNRRGISPILAQGGAAGQTYQQKVLTLSPVAYWPLNETSGTNADNVEGTATRDGTYFGVTLDSTDSPMAGERAGLFDGINDGIAFTEASPGLGDVWDGDEGTLCGWCKVANAGVWTDGTQRALAEFGQGASDTIFIIRRSGNNQLQFSRKVGGATKSVVHVTAAPTDWFHVGITWSVSGDAMKAWIDGAQVGTTQTGILTGITSLLFSGIGWDDVGNREYFSGYFSQWALFNSALSDADILTLATAI